MGLELGAGDYFPKPFELKELVAGIQSILGRAGNKKVTSVLQFPKLVIDLNRQTVKLDRDLLRPYHLRIRCLFITGHALPYCTGQSYSP